MRAAARGPLQPLHGHGVWLALLAGALLPLAYAPFGVWPLAPVCAAVLLFCWDGVAPREAARRGLAFGAGLFAVGTHWLYVSLHVFGKAPLYIALPLMAALIGMMAAYTALLGYWLNRLRPQPGPLRWLVAFPACWTLLEWTRGWFLTGFPWLSLGYTQSDSWLAGFAPVAGVFAMSAAVALTAGCLRLLVAGGARARLTAAVTLLALWAVAFALRHVEWTAPDGDPVRVSIVQGAVSQDRKWLPEELVPTMQLYRDLTRQHWDADLVVWPEAAIPALRVALGQYFRELRAQGVSNDTDLLTGVIDHDPETGRFFNGVLALSENGGIYYKRHLVPFGEYFPVPDFVREWMRLRNLPYSDYTPGPRDQRPLEVAGERVGVSICYEDVFGNELRAPLPGATLLVNVSNDAWFGTTIAPAQHLQIARLRALEAGRDLLRATNTGISAIVGADGRVRERIPQFETRVLSGRAQPRSGATPYVVVGDAAVVVAAALGLLAVLVVRRRV